MDQPTHYDIIIIGAGAAGLMAASTAGKRGRKVLLIEHSDKIGEKIRISGGGRCNFTNLHATSRNYLSQNPHFAKSALAGYTAQDFIALIESYGIAYHEKTLGQLFCDGSAKQIIAMLLDLCRQHQVEIRQQCQVDSVKKDGTFVLATNQGVIHSASLIIASGGLSIPAIGASDFGYRIARQFGLNNVPTRPALVPLHIKDVCSSLSGISNAAIVHCRDTSFTENILFTHKGLSGPAILQISSYLEKFQGTEIIVNLLPTLALHTQFMTDKNQKKTVANYLKPYLATRVIEHFAAHADFHQTLTDLSKERLMHIADMLHHWAVPITGSEGYAKAEVTAGGVDTACLSSKTMECKQVQGLYFIGEVVDVTGWLGGYNFQWAWSSGYAAGMAC
jgi:predicted Rossmann fold flavoprotein